MIHKILIKSREENAISNNKVLYVETVFSAEEVVSILQPRCLYEVSRSVSFRKKKVCNKCKKDHSVLTLEEAALVVPYIRILYKRVFTSSYTEKREIASFYFKPFVPEVEIYNGKQYTFLHNCSVDMRGLRELPTFEFCKMATSEYPFVVGAYELRKEGNKYILYRDYEHYNIVTSTEVASR